MASKPAIRFNCGHCGRLIKVPASKAGNIGSCPGCKEPITVPELDEPSLQQSAREAAAAIKKKPTAKENAYELSDPDQPEEEELVSMSQVYEVSEPEEDISLSMNELEEVEEDWLDKLPAAKPESERELGPGEKPKPGKKKVKTPKNKVSFGHALAVDGRAKKLFYAICLLIAVGVVMSVLPDFEFSRRGRTMSSNDFGKSLFYMAGILLFFGSPYVFLRTLKSWKLLRVGVDVPWRVIEHLDTNHDIKVVRIQYSTTGRPIPKRNTSPEMRSNTTDSQSTRVAPRNSSSSLRLRFLALPPQHQHDTQVVAIQRCRHVDVVMEGIGRAVFKPWRLA